MSLIKKLSGQTLIYGFSSVVGRFLNYLLVPLYTRQFAPEEYGIVTEVYALAGFLLVLLTYGMETAFFRFNEKYKGNEQAFSSGLWSLLFSSIGFYLLVWYFIDPISEVLLYQEYPKYILMLAGIISLDAITALPFAKLREQEKAIRFAFIKMINIIVNVSLNILLIIILPRYTQSVPVIDSIFISNLVASAITLLLLLPEFKYLKAGISRKMLREMLIYSLPLMIAGLAGMVNEMLDRVLLKRLLPYDQEINTQMLGIYGATYKLSILMSLFSQAFRYAAEPLFFKKAEHKDAPEFYAIVLKYFTYIGALVFLVISLFIDQIKHFLGSDFHTGLAIVPVLLLANLFLAMQVNLSIWYKIKDKTRIGAVIAIIGATITIALNILWIPKFGYHGSAWATLICYLSMASITYIVGRRYYPIPYDLRKIAFSIVFALSLFLFYNQLAKYLIFGDILKFAINILFIVVYVLVIYIQDFNNIKRDIRLK